MDKIKIKNSRKDQKKAKFWFFSEKYNPRKSGKSHKEKRRGYTYQEWKENLITESDKIKMLTESYFGNTVESSDGPSHRKKKFANL